MASNKTNMRPRTFRFVDHDGVEHVLDVDTIRGYQTRETLPLTRKLDTLWHRAAVLEGWQLEPGNPWPNGFHGMLIALDAAPAQSGLQPTQECVLALFADPAVVAEWVAQLERAGKRAIPSSYV